MNIEVALCSAVAVPKLPEGFAPGWIHLLPAGQASTRDGRGPYFVRDAKALMAASLAGGKLPLDENHSTDLAAPFGRPAPARGWIVELADRTDEGRGNGIWGRVEWTDAGRQIMLDREYNGISPVIEHRKDGTIFAILRASLTNVPNITGLTALHSQQALPKFNPGLMARLLDLTSSSHAIAGQPAKAARVNLGTADREVIRALGLATESYDAMLNPPAPPAGLDAHDLEIIRKLGIDPSTYAATKSPPPLPAGLDAHDLEIIQKLAIDPAEYATAKASQAA